MTTFLVFLLATSCLGISLFDSLSWFIYKDIVPGGLVNLSNDGREALCRAQAGGIQFFALSTFFWISCLAFHAFNILCRKKSEETLKSFFKYYFLICYTIPLITVIICLSFGGFGQTEDEVWCWIINRYQSLRFSLYYVPLVILWIFNVSIYVLLSRERYSSLSYGYIIKEGKRKLRLYILVFVIMKFPALLNRLCNLVWSDQFFLFLLQAIFDSLFGFFESLVYIVLVKKRLPNFCKPKEDQIGLSDPLISKETGVPYSSIAERMYYSSKGGKKGSINSV